MPGPRRIALVLAALVTVVVALTGPRAAWADGPVARIAQAAAPVLVPPNDPGAIGTPGGWRQLQWNFLAGHFGIDVEPAWARLAALGRPGGQGMVVAVLDTGVAYANHRRFRRSPDLTGTRFTAGYDFVDD